MVVAAAALSTGRADLVLLSVLTVWELSLPPDTDPNIYTEFTVGKNIPNTIQAEIRAWGGSPGGGLQYKLPMPIQQLEKEEFLKRK